MTKKEIDKALSVYKHALEEEYRLRKACADIPALCNDGSVGYAMGISTGIERVCEALGIYTTDTFNVITGETA